MVKKIGEWYTLERSHEQALFGAFRLFSLEENSMSEDHYNALLNRIREHCQQVAWDALDPNLRWNAGNTPRDPYERRYVHGRKSFIAFKKKHHGQIPWIAFPPATETQMLKTERQLGFALPPLLRLLYTQVANGGFGPGYGMIGAIGGFSFIDRGKKHRRDPTNCATRLLKS
jgi:hypothetical protein